MHSEHFAKLKFRQLQIFANHQTHQIQTVYYFAKAVKLAKVVHNIKHSKTI